MAKPLWFQETGPELYSKTAYFMDCACFFYRKRTGKVYMEPTCSSPHSLGAEKLRHKHAMRAAAEVEVMALKIPSSSIPAAEQTFMA